MGNGTEADDVVVAGAEVVAGAADVVVLVAGAVPVAVLDACGAELPPQPARIKPAVTARTAAVPADLLAVCVCLFMSGPRS
jgi:hypothetical protein